MRLIKRVARVMMVAGLAIWFAMPFSVIVSASAGAFESNMFESSDRPAHRSAIDAYSKLPLSFEASFDNSTAKFVSRGNGYNFYLSATEAIFQLRAGPDVNRLSRGAALGSPRNAGSPSAVHKLPEPLRDEVASRPVQSDSKALIAL